MTATPPRGCRDVRLWEVATELLDRHAAEPCDECRPPDAPCGVVTAAREGLERAMQPNVLRWLSGDDYRVGRLYSGRLVGADVPPERRQPGGRRPRWRPWR